jgi:hypothetical protein
MTIIKKDLRIQSTKLTSYDVIAVGLKNRKASVTDKILKKSYIESNSLLNKYMLI